MSDLAQAVNWTAASSSSQGGRNYQEDECLFTVVPQADGQRLLLAVLADGMGGHAGGAVASNVATESFVEDFKAGAGETSERLRRSLSAANEAVAIKSRGNPDLSGMGCTMVGLVAYPDRLDWVSVGDSPLWLYSGNALHRLNEDHSMMPVLLGRVERGEMTASAASGHPARNALRSAVVGEDIPLVDLATMPLQPGADDVVVLASDGLCTLSDQEIAAILQETSGADANTIADRLIAAVDQRGLPDQDNTTVVVLRPQTA